jgi:endonuclease YncB( thermonuclease family)
MMRPGQSIASLLLFEMLLLLAPGDAIAREPAKGRSWSTLDACTLVPNPSNDGDSFHVLHNGKEYIFRLYFVDAPETSRQVPERVQEQAEYWDIRESQVLAAGREAARVSLSLLDKPFTVYTRYEDARGQSELPRHFAFVRTSGGELLSERLAEQGLARAYGLRRSMPDGTPYRTYQKRIESLEATARRKHLGAWRLSGDSTGALREATVNVTPGTLVLNHSVTLYSTSNSPPRFAGSIPKGTRVEVLGAESALLVHVRYARDRDLVEGLCRRTELEQAGVSE